MPEGYGDALRVELFGESHGPAVGVTVDGLPAGEEIDLDELAAFMARRASTSYAGLATPRQEADAPIFFSGVEAAYSGMGAGGGASCNGGTSCYGCAGNGASSPVMFVTNGYPLCAIIENGNVHKGDYCNISTTPRPSHADFAAMLKYGDFADLSGGGHFSGRLTAPMCVAGGIAKQVLARRGVAIGAHLASVGGVEDARFDATLLSEEDLLAPGAKAFPTIDDTAGERMREEILAASGEKDSVGGTVECAVIGLPAGIGGPLWEGIEGRLALALFGIPAVKGVEFGAGFAAAGMRGSQHNDPIVSRDGTACMEKNDAGGILGGISTGMPVVARVAIKPTPSIGRRQRTVDMGTGAETEIEIAGRHDPCIALRAVPVVEAAVAIALLDMIMQEGKLD